VSAKHLGDNSIRIKFDIVVLSPYLCRSVCVSVKVLKVFECKGHTFDLIVRIFTQINGTQFNNVGIRNSVKAIILM
jgi:hypothetical protein